MTMENMNVSAAMAEEDLNEPVGIEGNDDVISRLNGLIEICKDGQEGFKNAAESIADSDLKSVFYEFSRQRAGFTGVLQECVRSLGGEPETESTFLGSLHRGWMELKSVVTGKDAGAILNECERGEDAAKAAYQVALEAALPANVADIVTEQANAITAAHNRIKSLRDAENKGSGF